MKEWEDYLNSKIKGEYSCVLEEYKDYNSVFPKGKRLSLDYGLYGVVNWNLSDADKINCDRSNNLLLFYDTGKGFEQIYMDVPPEDLKKEIDKIKEKLCNLGIEKEIVDNSSSDY